MGSSYTKQNQSSYSKNDYKSSSGSFDSQSATNRAGSSENNRGEWTLSRVMTRSAWLHIKDALEIDKFRIYIGNYQRGKGAKAQATAYVDVDSFRVVLQDLALRGELPSKLYKKQTAEFFGGSERDGQLEARIFKVSDRSEMNSPIVFEIAHGPGKRNFQGGIQPAGKLQSVSIMLDRNSARKLAYSVLAELSAWESATVMSRRRQSEQESLSLRKGKGEEPSHDPQSAKYERSGRREDKSELKTDYDHEEVRGSRSTARKSAKSVDRDSEEPRAKRSRGPKNSDRESEPLKSDSGRRGKRSTKSEESRSTRRETTKSSKRVEREDRTSGRQRSRRAKSPTKNLEASSSDTFSKTARHLRSLRD